MDCGTVRRPTRARNLASLVVLVGVVTAAIAGSARKDASAAVVSQGIELSAVRGWFANIYGGLYDPATATVHPAQSLWPAGGSPGPIELSLQDLQLERFGAGADVVAFNPNPILSDDANWLRRYLARSSRPFFIMYEHINGTRYHADATGFTDMNDPYNRSVFIEDIDFIYRQAIAPFSSRYVTVNGRPVVYLWSTSQMRGDFASLLRDVKQTYSLFFLAGGEQPSSDSEARARMAALDGFMSYALGDPSKQGSYVTMINSYQTYAFSFRQYLRDFERETGERKLLIPTFQAAYDDSRLPDRLNTDGTPRRKPMYARSLAEMQIHAETILAGMFQSRVFDPYGPFVIYSELYEGGAVIESIPRPEPAGQYVGYGTARLGLLEDYFGR